MKHGQINIKLDKTTNEYDLTCDIVSLLKTDQENFQNFTPLKNNKFTIYTIKYENDLIDLIIIKPCLTIKNCLPISVEFQIFVKAIFDSKLLSQQILKPQESLSLNELNHSNIQFKFRVYGAQWSQEEPLIRESILKNSASTKSEKNIRTIELLDTRTQKLQNIKIYVPTRFQVFIYCESAIMDESNMDLVFFSVKDTKINESLLIPGQTEESWEYLNKTPIYLFNDQQKVIIGKKGCPYDKTSPLAINQDSYFKVGIVAKSVKKADLFALDLGVKAQTLICGNRIY